MVTEDVARMLEDIIRQRVKDKAWDEAERKVRRVEDLSQYKKKHVLDQENSKLSLAQVNKEELFKLDEWAKSEKKKHFCATSGQGTGGGDSRVGQPQPQTRPLRKAGSPTSKT